MLKKSFKIDLSIYEKDQIISGIQDFLENGFIIEFSQDIIFISGDDEEEIQNIFDELMNYILSL